MTILEQFLDAIQYRINDAWEHQWASYEGAQVLGCTNEYASMNVVFSRYDQTVIEITVVSELEAETQVAYRWLNPDYLEAIMAEADNRGINRNQALERMDYVDLDVVEDVLEKGQAMLANAKFDPRIQVPLDLEDHELLELFKMAHGRDITLNALMEEIILKAVADTQPKNSAE